MTVHKFKGMRTRQYVFKITCLNGNYYHVVMFNIKRKSITVG